MVAGQNEIIAKIRRFIDAANNSGIRVIEAYLYGSHARQEAKPESDIDVALVTEGGRKDSDKLWRLRRRIDVLIEPVAFTPERFANEVPLVWEIKQHGLQLVEQGRWKLA